MEITFDHNGFYTPQAASLSNPEKWMIDVFRGESSDSGVAVNDQTAIGSTATFFSINRISNDVAQLPLSVMQRADGGDTADMRHPGGKLFRSQPGAVANPFQQKKAIQTHALLYGNGRAFIVRNGRQEPVELVPLEARRMRSILIHDEGDELQARQKWHLLYSEDGQPPLPIPDRDILHIHGLSLNGIEGLDMLDTFRHSFGLTLGAEKYANRFYRNDGTPGLVLEAPPGVFRNQQEAQEFLRRFNEQHRGLENTGKVGLLREGVKANVLRRPGKDDQLIESREFQVREIMRIYGVPVIPGVSDSQSYNTLEQLNRAYLLHCLGPWLKAWQYECNAKLLTRTEQQSEIRYFEFDTGELLRPDAGPFAEYLTKLVGGKILNSNEAREELGLPPRAGGEVYENPATSSNQTAAPADRQQAALAKLRPVAEFERRRVVDMAANASNFCGWLEGFYAKHSERLLAAVAELGGPAWIAAAHCDESKESLLEIAGKTKTKSELVAAVTQAAAAWDSRLEHLAAACAGE